MKNKLFSITLLMSMIIGSNYSQAVTPQDDASSRLGLYCPARITANQITMLQAGNEITFTALKKIMRYQGTEKVKAIKIKSTSDRQKFENSIVLLPPKVYPDQKKIECSYKYKKSWFSEDNFTIYGRMDN